MSPAWPIRRALTFVVGLAASGAFYLLLIDITDAPELIAGAVVAVMAVAGAELASAHRTGASRVPLRCLWLLRRPVSTVPGDVWLLAVAAARQLRRREAHVGEFCAVGVSPGSPLAAVDGGASTLALAQLAGSLSPNTFLVDADRDRGALLAHQLRPSPGRTAVDPLELG